jgi:hypothetical protein
MSSPSTRTAASIASRCSSSTQSRRRQRRFLDSNQSLATFEPISVREREFRREKVGEARDWAGIFGDHRLIPGDRDRSVPQGCSILST